MCGIGGIKRLEDDQGQLARPILPVQIDLLVNSLEYRGNDAAGVALVSLSGDIHIFKDHEPAWQVTSQPKYQDFIATHLDAQILTALVHTRKATKGSPFRNDNNHPLRKNAGVVVHNGMLHNDDRLFADLKLERGAETDSDILRAILDDANGISKKSLSKMSQVGGSVASALCHPSDPTKLMLLRSGNPLVTADDGELFYFASDKRAIYRAARPWVERHGFIMQRLAPDLAFLTMPNDTGWIIGNAGLEWHDKFNSSQVRYRYNQYSDTYSPHARPARREAQKVASEPKAYEAPRFPARAEREPIIVPVRDQDNFGVVSYVKCPNPSCQKILALTTEQEKKPQSRLMCSHCKTNLGGATRSTKALQKTVN